MNLFYPAVCVSCRWRKTGSNSKEQRARHSGPLRLLSVEKLASLPLCDCWTSVQHGESGKKPLIFYSEGKQMLTFNAAVLDIWIFCVRNVSKSAVEVCKHDMMSLFALLLAEKYHARQQNEHRTGGVSISTAWHVRYITRYCPFKNRIMLLETFTQWNKKMYLTFILNTLVDTAS